MKKTSLAGLAIGLFFMGLAGLAHAITIADVGSKDTLLAWADLGNANPVTETTWVNSILNPDVTFEYKIEMDDDPLGWLQVTDAVAGTYAHRLVGVGGVDLEPEYFLIKTGNVQTSAYRHWLYANNNNLNYAVINLLDMGIVSVTNIGKISHISEFGGVAPVPEPATMLLLGTGLAGLASTRRKKKA